MILVIDNYDSFTYNLVQYLGELGAAPEVRRNDAITVDEIKRLSPAGIVISPGPGTPTDAGISVELVRELGRAIPILGVCLGHQAIGEAFGGKIVKAATLMHGKTSRVSHGGSGLFSGLPSPLTVMRYHSLVIRRDSMPDVLEIIATAIDNPSEIHAVKHRSYPVWGVQFHPESIMTQCGKELLGNFLRMAQ